MTSLDPRLHDQKEIVINNYDDRGHVQTSKKCWDNTNWVVELKMDKNEVIDCGDSKRDVYLNEDDIHLKNYQYRIYENPNRREGNSAKPGDGHKLV